MTDSYESDDIQDILSWYQSEGWCGAYDNGSCAFNIYENGRELSFDEGYDLGFYD